MNVRDFVRASALFLALVAPGCVPAPASSPAPGGAAAPAYVRRVQPEEADLWRGQNYQGLVLDVRTAPEFDDALGHLPNAVLVPLSELEPRLGEIAAYRDRPVLVYDRDGPRAEAGAQLLVREGFRDVGWVVGGLVAYRRWQESPTP
jgi:rhodanese-related sulfurtransferase